MVQTFVSLISVAVLATWQPNVVRAAQQSDQKTAAKSANRVIVNINTASVAEIETLPGIGAKTAARIVEYRQKNGPFKKIEEVMNVRGVGEKNFLTLKDQLSVTNAKTDNGAR